MDNPLSTPSNKRRLQNLQNGYMLLENYSWIIWKKCCIANVLDATEDIVTVDSVIKLFYNFVINYLFTFLFQFLFHFLIFFERFIVFQKLFVNIANFLRWHSFSIIYSNRGWFSLQHITPMFTLTFLCLSLLFFLVISPSSLSFPLLDRIHFIPACIFFANVLRQQLSIWIFSALLIFPCF